MLADLFISILMLSIMASAIICVIFITKFVFRDRLSAKWHYYIWGLLFIRLIIPFTPQYSFNFHNFIKQPQTEFMQTVAESGTEIEISPNESLNNKEPAFVQETFVLNENIPEYEYSNEVQKKHNSNLTRKYFEFAAVVWSSGVLILLIYSLLINFVIRYKIRKTVVHGQNDSVISILEECRKIMKISKYIPVIFQSYVNAPALYGVFRPVLLMPEDITNKLNEEELRHVVLHELSHYRHKDNAAGLVLLLLNAIHWFNPLIWLAANKIREDRELVCDQQALSYIKVNEKRNYARTIVKILELFSEKQFIQSASSIIQGRSSNMEWRLKFIKAIKSKSTKLAAFVTVLVILAGVLTVNYINGNVKFPKSTYAIADVKDNAGLEGQNTDNVQLRGNILDRNGVKLVERTSEGSNYTYGSLASHVIGFVNEEDKGVQGIEALMDKDGLDSDNITLTIDKNIQMITENVLEKTMKDFKVTGGAAAVVMDPSTGEVLAMCSKPDFDLNFPYSIPDEFNASEWDIMPEMEKVQYLTKNVWINKAIADTYEPASAFKAITAAAGLEEGVITPDSIVNDYTVKVSGYDINCWTKNKHGEVTFRQAMYNSCNPPFVRIAQSLGIDKFYNYVKDFGFYDLSGIELYGEGKSLFHKEPTEIDMAVASFGQRFQITPIQLLSAYGAIANGGELFKPQVIKEITDKKGNIIKEFEPQVVRKVISEQTSITLKEMLEGVVSEGTGKNAYKEGYMIAGKTGTSETQTEGIYIASFVGFAPADKPKVACIVIMDNPQGDVSTGGVVAAPAAGEIMKQSLDYIRNLKY